MSAKANPYRWRGIAYDGKILTGTEYANTKETAILQLQNKHIHVTQLALKQNRYSRLNKRRIKPSDILLLFRYLSTLLTTGIPLNIALQLIKKNPNPTFCALIENIQDKIELGFTLSNALQCFPHYFDEHTRQLILIGEQTGTLDKQLTHICAHKEKQFLLKKQLQSLLFYPLILVCVTLLITVGMLVFIIPRFADIYQQFHAPLPHITVFVLSLSSFIQTYGPYAIGILAVLIYAVSIWVPRSTWVTQGETLLLYLPFTRTLTLNVMALRFASALSSQLEAGVTLSEALRLFTESHRPSNLLPTFLILRETILRGSTLSTAIEQTGLFSAFFLQMVKVGEQSGTLGTLLGQTANVYQANLEQTTQRFIQLLEPLIIMILGVLIGGLVIAMYLPIFTLGTVI